MPLVGWGNYAPEPFGTSCTLDWWLAQASVSGQSFVMCMLIFCLVLPTGIIVFSYIMIIFKVKSSAKEVSHFDTRNKHNHNLEMKLTKVCICTMKIYYKGINKKLAIRVIRCCIACDSAWLHQVAMLICAGFLIAWIPYAVVSVISAFGEPDSVPISVSVVPTLLAKSSAVYNPIIYQVIDCKKNCTNSACFQSWNKKRKQYRTPRWVLGSHTLVVYQTLNFVKNMLMNINIY